MNRERRTKGEGTIFQRNSGKWVAKLTRNGHTITRTADTEREAKRKLEEIKHEFIRRERLLKQESDLLSNSNKVSTELMFNRFLKYKTSGRGKVSERSAIRLESTIRTHIIPKCGSVPFLQLTSKDIETILDDMYNDDFGHSSIKKVFDAFNACFKYAVFAEKYLDITENPMLSVEMIPISEFERKEIKIYSKQEIERLERECLLTNDNGQFKYKYGRVFIFLLNTGLREGEMCALNKTDLDIENRLLYVCKTATNIKISDKGADARWKTVIKSSPKTESGCRYVPLNETALKMAKMVLEEFPNGEKLIYTQKDNVVAPSSLNKYLDTILRNARIEKQGGLHILRDTFASRLFEAGVNVQTIAKILGHADSKVTEKHYIKIIEKIKMKAVYLVDKV